MSKQKRLQEQIRFMENELDKYGIKNYETRKVKTGHVIISFEVNGQPRSVTVGASTDYMARLRNRTILRGILEGRR